MKNIKANRHFSRCLVLINPGRPLPTRPNDCWFGRKESSQVNENKQTNKPNAPTLPSQAQLSLQFMLSPFEIRWATPPHQSTTCSYWEFRKRHIDVSDTMLQYWMLITGFWCLRCMGESRKFYLHGRIQKVLSGGGGCPENFILVFSQRAVRTWPPFRSNWTQGVLLLLEVVNNSISKETYNNLWSSRWDANPLSPTLRSRTCDA